MLLRPHGPDDRPERDEVTLLDDERVALEERQHTPFDIDHAVDGEDMDCTPRPFRTDTSALKETPEGFEHRSVPLVLRNLEDRVDLPTTYSAHVRVSVYRYGEATFSVDETNDPMRFELNPRSYGFLLIVPTRHIVTEHHCAPYEEGVTATPE